MTAFTSPASNRFSMLQPQISFQKICMVLSHPVFNLQQVYGSQDQSHPLDSQVLPDLASSGDSDIIFGFPAFSLLFLCHILCCNQTEHFNFVPKISWPSSGLCMDYPFTATIFHNPFPHRLLPMWFLWMAHNHFKLKTPQIRHHLIPQFCCSVSSSILIQFSKEEGFILFSTAFMLEGYCRQFLCTCSILILQGIAITKTQFNISSWDWHCGTAD